MHVHGHPELTKNQSLVYGALETASAPMSAYALLDALHGQGLRAPLQVYRALDKLVAFGMVHRLESLNAFVACRHPDCDSHETIAFTICDTCGQVGELGDAKLGRQLKTLAGEAGFALTKSTVELRGLCAACSSQ